MRDAGHIAGPVGSFGEVPVSSYGRPEQVVAGESFLGVGDARGRSTAIALCVVVAVAGSR